MRPTIIASTLALMLLGSAPVWSQPSATPDAGASPHGQVPGPNATPPQAQQNSPDGSNPAQPVPGAMPGSDAVPSTLSAKNAADDKLMIVAYTFKQLSDEQRRAIYQAVSAKSPASATTAVGGPTGAEIGSVLSEAIPLAAVPDDVAAQVPPTKGYQYVKVGDKVLLVSPANRIVVGVITPQSSAQ
jgi:hypothetical protein